MNFNNILSNFLRFDEGGNSGNIIQIQDNLYNFNVSLWNGETRTGITFTAIEELQIVDDLRHAHAYGYIVFTDHQDVLESFEGIEGKSDIKAYNFRGDGRDYLEVEITPQINQTCVGANTKNDDTLFSLKYTFSVYKIEEDVKENKGEKYKKLYFWDVDYQLLTEIDSTFSTADMKPSVKNNSKQHTGDAIKYLLKKCLGKSGFKASKKWDKGASMIEYRTNGTYKAIDDLQYLLEYQISDSANGNSPCILKKERYTDEYTLIPITSYLENSNYGSNDILSMLGGRHLREDFYIGKLDTSGKGLGNEINFDLKNSPNSFNAVNYNLIETYSFLKPDADMIQKDISTHLVYSDDARGFFKCSIKPNNFQNSIKTIFENNIKKNPNFKKSQGNSIIPANQLRKDNKNVQHVFASGLSLEDDVSKYNFGKNKALMASVFKNTAICFRTKGLTKRRSGTFFNVNRLNNQTTKSHNNIMLGSYFTTMVIHEFKKGMYYNHIYGTKSSTEEKHNFAELL
jgi:hypothetical protein